MDPRVIWYQYSQHATMYDFAAIPCPLLSKMYHVQEMCAMTSRIAMKYYVMPV